MTSDETDLLAAEYVLGTLDNAARHELERRLDRESKMQAIVAKWERRLAVLDLETPSVDVAPGLWDRIRTAVEPQPAAATDFLTIPAVEGEWVRRAPGIERKTLFLDPEAGIGSYLYRMAPGAVIREHAHGSMEECVMLEGEVTFADTHLEAGDFHIAFAGSTHAEITSRSGAIFYLRGAIS